MRNYQFITPEPLVRVPQLIETIIINSTAVSKFRSVVYAVASLGEQDEVILKSVADIISIEQ